MKEQIFISVTPDELQTIVKQAVAEVLEAEKVEKIEGERLLTVKEAAAMTGCSESKIRVLLAKGDLTRITAFGGVKVKYSELLKKMNK